MACPCGSGAEERACCGRFLAGAPAPTAEALMRSRYTAYVRGAIDYLVETWDSDELDRAAVEKWARESHFLSLEIVGTERGGPDDDQGVVEFIARAKSFVHHERSRFRRVAGRWKFVDGEQPKPRPVQNSPKPGRNDPCPCGSGKKYKRCHG